MIGQTIDLWKLVRRSPQIDPDDLAQAVCAEAERQELDYRTRLLIRDSINALRSHWGSAQLNSWLAQCSARNRLDAISAEQFDDVGYPSLPKRLMKKTDPEDVRQFLREIGITLHQPVRIDVGGAIALILSGHLSRHTEDVDIVGDVPPELRNKHALFEGLHKRYGLEVGHVQTHYFPAGWEQRIHSLGSFGKLQVYLLDVYDVFLSKLFSKREKDRDDLRVVKPQLDKDILVHKLGETAGGLLAVPDLKENAEANWQILFGEGLPQ
jgi:Nucleotidyltransferase of unknown function (DUF6036)